MAVINGTNEFRRKSHRYSILEIILEMFKN